MSWLQKIMPTQMNVDGQDKANVPEGVWTKCNDCGAVLYRAEMERAMQVCPKCGSHEKLSGRDRLNLFLDAEPRTELCTEIEPKDPLKFRDSRKYRERLTSTQRKTGEREAVVAMEGAVHQLPVVACALDFRFMGGSMGSVVGETLAQAAQVSAKKQIPFIAFAASGGARMQEGLFSLMQMAKTSAALTRLSEKGVPYISVLTNPTTGGVAASWAMLGDVNIAEPGAQIGFAGPRVIEQTVQQTLPEGFQTSEFLLEHGAIDMIVERADLRDRIHGLLAMFTNRSPDRDHASA